MPAFSEPKIAADQVCRGLPCLNVVKPQLQHKVRASATDLGQVLLMMTAALSVQAAASVQHVEVRTALAPDKHVAHICRLLDAPPNTIQGLLHFCKAAPHHL
jgi:hypothetical protein